MFGTIAKNYDRTNAVLSFQLHRLWNKELIRQVTTHNNPESLLDLCSGTGEIAFSYLKSVKSKKKVILLDFCEEMLSSAKNKGKAPLFEQHDLTYILGDAQAIPLNDESMHAATIAYGIRNVQSPKKCIEDVFRVLKPGGSFGILELTEPKNRLLNLSHKFYLKFILPLIGNVLTSNKEAYQYLCNSINQFVKPEKIEEILKETGFTETKRIPLTGGIATIIYGKKPLKNTLKQESEI